MWIAVIPACNEAASITTVLRHLQACHCLARLLVVANGCTDATEENARQAAAAQENAGPKNTGQEKAGQIEILSFPEPLGIDIPRAVGAAYAQKKYHPLGIVFVDGDLIGNLTVPVCNLINGLKQGLDLALTDCYPDEAPHSALAASVLKARETLNKQLKLDTKIGLATPSHGPHAISASLLAQLPPQVLAVPPLALAFAALHHYKIGVAATIAHDLLGSKIRSNDHAAKIAATIIADCKLALAYATGTTWPEVLAACTHSEGLMGYQKQRRFDLLNAFLDNF